MLQMNCFRSLFEKKKWRKNCKPFRYTFNLRNKNIYWFFNKMLHSYLNLSTNLL